MGFLGFLFDLIWEVGILTNMPRRVASVIIGVSLVVVGHLFTKDTAIGSAKAHPGCNQALERSTMSDSISRW